MNPSKDSKSLYLFGLLVLVFGVLNFLVYGGVDVVLFAFLGCIFTWVVAVQVDLYGEGKGVR